MTTDRHAVPRPALVDQLLELGVDPGGVLLVHASFRAVRPVERGPLGLAEALLDVMGVGGTVVMPSWSGRDDEVFDPHRSPASPALGVLAETFRGLPAVRRSDHPFAFAAAGPHAAYVTDGPLPLPPHGPGSPVDRVRELDGQVLLLGVGHHASTTVHLAELLAGVPYRVPRHCTVLREGEPVRVEYQENDHCCRRFVRVGSWMREAGLQEEGRVGRARARLVRSRDLVEVVTARLRRDPLLFLHERHAGCHECDEARESLGAGAALARTNGGPAG